MALARDGTDQQKTYATMALRHLAANADNNASISRAYVRAREKSNATRSGGVIGAEAEGARASAKKEAIVKATIAVREATAEARAESKVVAGRNELGFSEILAEAEGEAVPRSAVMPMPRLAAAVVARVQSTGAKAKLAPPKESRMAEEAPWLKRLRASGVKMVQTHVPNLPQDKAPAASSSRLEEEHGLSTEAGTEARTYHYDGDTLSDAIEASAGSVQDDSTGSWKRFYLE